MDVTLKTLPQARPLAPLRLIPTARPAVANAPADTAPPPSTEGSKGLEGGASKALAKVAQHEVQTIHDRVVADLRTRILGGSYAADLNVVADRVAEVLGIL